MKTLGIVVGTIAVLIVGFIIVWKVAYPDYGYRYRLALAFDIDGKMYAGSSVIEIIWTGGPEVGDVGPYGSNTYGQAVYIDLGPRGAIVGALGPGTTSQDPPDGAIQAIFLAPLAFGNHSTHRELPQLPRLRGRRELTPDNMPRLIWFANPAEPRSARKFRVDQIPSVFGPNARLTEAYVEITSDPVVVDIVKKLPWIERMRYPPRPFEGSIQIEPGFGLAWTMFIGDRS